MTDDEAAKLAQRTRDGERIYERALKLIVRKLFKSAPKEGGLDALITYLLTANATAVYYSQAVFTARAMAQDIDRRSAAAWARPMAAEGGFKGNMRRASQTMAAEIKKQLPPEVLTEVVQRNVTLIKSLPEDAALWVQKRAAEINLQGGRSDLLAKEIQEQCELVSLSRARLIARTEVGRASAEAQKIRAKRAGSTGFKWLTAEDHSVRPTHAELNRKVFSWDDPPVCDKPNIRALPGAVFNCRCVANPQFDAPIKAAK